MGGGGGGGGSTPLLPDKHPETGMQDVNLLAGHKYVYLLNLRPRSHETGSV